MNNKQNVKMKATSEIVKYVVETIITLGIIPLVRAIIKNHQYKKQTKNLWEQSNKESSVDSVGKSAQSLEPHGKESQ